jgi:radical SAM protein with 4Fe4S-binding SPASM domain
MVRRDIGRVYVQLFDTALANWYGEPAGMCVHAEMCGLQVALEHTGDLYCCDHFVEPNYLLGNITETPMQQLITASKQMKFGQDKRDTLTQYCRDCDVRFACNGGCPKDRFATSPYGERGAALPVSQLQGVLSSRSSDANDGQPPGRRPCARRADTNLRRRRRPARPQRTMHLRQRP